MDTRVHPAVEESLLDLPHEERLAPEIGECDIRQAVARRADDHDLDLRAARPERVGDLP